MLRQVIRLVQGHPFRVVLRIVSSLAARPWAMVVALGLYNTQVVFSRPVSLVYLAVETLPGPQVARSPVRPPPNAG
jgi:hypothetical protein